MQIDKNIDTPARKRLSCLFDDGEYTEINAFIKQKDSLSGVITAYGYVNGNPVYAFSQDKTINGGAVGMAHAQKIAKLYSLAAKTGTPIVGIHDSNGAFVDGTAESLNAYGIMLEGSAVVSGVVPQISLVAGTCAGSSAILACSSDFVVMTKDGEFFTAPNSDGKAEIAEKSGIAVAVCDTDELAIEKVKSILNLLPINNLATIPMFEYDETNAPISGNITEIVNGVCDANSVVELSANFGKASYTALATIEGSTVGICGTDKTSDKLNSDDCNKIARFVRTCDAFAIPVVTFVNTAGFEASSNKNAIESVRDMTKLANCYAEATTIKISVVTGKAIGSSFVALAGKNSNSDFTFAWDNAVIAPLALLTAVEFLWHDKLKNADNLDAKRAELADEYIKTLASAKAAGEKGAIDDVIAMEDTRTTLISALNIMAGKRVSKLPKKHNNMPM